ncbi:hypothetical protein KBY29_21715 [Ruegeria pomeroyi]|nr:hypothetical protein [Ruegeria pomeroyi]
MAQIDATGLTFTFDAFAPDNVDHNAFVNATPFSYHWTSTNLYNITALGYLGNITAGLGGTVSAINIMGAAFQPGLSITGLNTPLVDLLDTGDPANNQRKFWDTVLEGDTDILMPTSSGSLSIMGDFVRVATGQTRYGGDDRFIGTQPAPTSGTTTGDAIRVEAGGTLFGGVDRFENTTSSNLIGDVGNMSFLSPNNLGTTHGGDDIFVLEDTSAIPSRFLSFLVGDVDHTGFSGTLYGGDDTARITNFASISTITGDVYNAEGATFGGDDVLTIETTIPGRSFTSASYLVGDGYSANNTGGAFLFTGGNDRLTANNANVSYVAGDLLYSTYTSVQGGDDIISVAGTFPNPGPIHLYSVTPFISGIFGDMDSFSGLNAESFTGGDDIITSNNVSSGPIYGDLNSHSGPGAFRGGDDQITLLMDRSNTPFSSTIYGDANNISQSTDVITGDDIIELDLHGSPGTSVSLFGDVGSFSPSGPSMATFGDDRIVLNAASNQSGTLYGDISSASSSDNMTLIYGHDTLIGGAAHDMIFGDAGSAPTVTGTLLQAGGNDMLDGRDGNDTLDGGLGLDTAVFSLDQSVFVSLDGIPGSDPMNPIHAIGQGNDRLISIENVIGSSRGDVIIGNGGDNIIEGAGGADNMIGNGGIDTLSYASSAGFVNVSLATGYAGGGSGSHAVGDTFLNGGGGSSFYHVTGSDHNDLLNGDANNNYLRGGEGNDNLRGRAGADTLDGGAGEDWIDYSDSPANINVSLQTGFANGGVGTHALGDVFIDIENVRGTSGGDRITGNTGDNVFEGLAGNDSMFGGAGSDTADYASSGSFVNVSLLTGFTGGGAGNHAIGDTFDSIENLRGSAHNDILNGSNGNNTLRGRAGGDALNGNGGIDAADYADSTAFVNVSLLTGFAGGGGGNHATGDTFNSIENLLGSAHNDILNGNNDSNLLEGRAGGDVLRGNGGDDTASYASSDEGVIVSLATGFTQGGHAAGDSFDSIEDLMGSDFDDFLSGDGNDNVLAGGMGNDTLRGRVGADTLDGGADIDTADYGDASGAVNISLNTGFTAGAHAAGDTFISIENLTGSAHNDTLSGDGNANVLTGLAGNDSLRGFGGADNFAFGDGFGNDTIADFEDGVDKIDMSAHSQISGIADLTVVNSGADALVSDGFGNSILLLGEANNISGDDFIF